MKILRLSLFNIKKHRKESFVIIFLTIVSMLFFGIGIINIEKADRMFDEMFEKTGSYHNIFLFPEKSYRNEFSQIVEEDERVTRSVTFDDLQFDISTAISYKKSDGSKAQFQAVFITEEDEKKIERFEKKTSLSDEEIDGFTHPVWVPYYLKYNMGFSEGDDLTLVISGKEYPFQIAGFYEAGLCSSVSGNGIKCVLTDADYDMMSAVVPEHRRIAFDTKDGVITSDEEAGELTHEFEQKFEAISGKDIFLWNDQYYTEKLASTSTAEILMGILAFVSIVTVISCLFMIRHKITNDIDDQMESIGVLEALGYRSREISGAYIYEYLLLTVIGVLVGGILIFVTDPLMTRVLKTFIGHDFVASGNALFLIIPAVLLVILTLFTSLMHARRVKKYPPVVAFRKGIKTHHFGKNLIPIERTKSDINGRLGLKGLVSGTGQNIGMFVCILVASLTITFFICLSDVFRDKGAVFLNFTGIEKGIMIGFDEETDTGAVMEEIKAREDVRKCLIVSANNGFSINGNDNDVFQCFAYDDFGELENLPVSEGRFPVHDNEILLGSGLVKAYNLSVGDSVLVKYNSIEKQFIICGTTKLIMNEGKQGYMTSDGFRQFMSPSECIRELFVYAADGVSEEKLKSRLTEEYGSVEDTVGKSLSEGTYEERIKAKADEQMALLKSKYGVSNVSYAIKVGDKIITGNSGSFKLKEITTIKETVESVLGGISVITQILSVVLFIIISVIISIIMNFLIDSNIKRERQAMGTLKAMGYTSKDIRKQIIVRIMPVAIPGVIAGATLSILVVNMFMNVAFSTNVGFRLFWIPVAIVIISLYVYVTTYISAGKVKKVSATELMTE